MLNGYFENCYGLKKFVLPNINFRKCNRAVIYAPNGVMKSSLSKVFEDISKGERPCDRIFRNATSSYSVTHYSTQYIYGPNSIGGKSSPTDRIYVVNTYDKTFEFTKETVSTLLADETTRNEYNVLVSQFAGEVKQIEDKLRTLTGLPKTKVKEKIIEDLGLGSTADWPDIFEKINEDYNSYNAFGFLDECKYIELFNDKVMAVYGKNEFINFINEYISSLNELLRDNPILNDKFTDKNAEGLGKELVKHNLFDAQHFICLKDGVTVIRSLREWNKIVEEQLSTLYAKPELSSVFKKLKQLLTSNAEVTRLREIIIAHREIIPQLSNIKILKLNTWLYCFSKLDVPFADSYKNISKYTTRMRELYEQASAQSERWQQVVDEFNRRFRVPFEVQIENKANFLLKDEAPNLSFKYSRGVAAKQSAVMQKDDLMESLSTGEKRALYILYILFDLERIKRQAESGGGQFLVLADDIADSFDYKNKYAIIEYLNDLAGTPNIDLLVLTHNFDFYRTVKSRLGIFRSNCYIAKRNDEGEVTITEFKYQKDFFKNVVIDSIKSGKIDDDDKTKRLFSSIPFYRNLCEYSGNDDEYSKLTCFLHLKTTPLDTESAKLTDLWDIINPFLGNVQFMGVDENYLSAVNRIAESCVNTNSSEVLLDNKLVIAIATRLKAEKFLRGVIVKNIGTCEDANSNQTREWYILAKPYMTTDQKMIIDDVQLITPESIHLNSFMFEPLIDISDWVLKDLFTRVSNM